MLLLLLLLLLFAFIVEAVVIAVIVIGVIVIVIIIVMNYQRQRPAFGCSQKTPSQTQASDAAHNLCQATSCDSPNAFVLQLLSSWKDKMVAGCEALWTGCMVICDHSHGNPNFSDIANATSLVVT